MRRRRRSRRRRRKSRVGVSFGVVEKGRRNRRVSGRAIELEDDWRRSERSRFGATSRVAACSVSEGVAQDRGRTAGGEKK